MTVTIQLKRGSGAPPALADGEPGWDTTAHVLYVGTGGTNYAVNAAGYTDEQAQDAVGAILTDTATVDFTYDDAANAITADVKAGSVGPTQLANTAVTPGSYTLASITVDAQGRITAASNGSASATLADGNYGDVTVSGTGTVIDINAGAVGSLEIASDAVSNAKLANMPASTIKGNNTAGSADPLDLTVSQVKTMLSLTGTNSGDVTLAGETYLSVASQVITAAKVTEAQQNLTDLTTGNVSSTKHGYAPKSPADATQFLNGAATPAFAAVKGSDLSMSDVTTNDVSTTRHGFAPKAPADATKFLNGANPPAWTVPAGSPLDINGLTATDPALDDQLPEYDTSATANRKAQVDRVLGLARYAPGGRLYMTSGDPLANGTGATLYYGPYLHDAACLWDGTRWVLLRFPETSLALSVTNAVVYDVFALLSSGALALETLAWTSTTARATAVTFQDGRLCKSGDKTRLYLGTLKASNTNACTDQVANRFLWNHYNQVERPMRAVETTASWTYGTNSWRLANNAAANSLNFVLGQDRPVRAHVLVTADVASGAQYAPGIGLDRSSANDATLSPVSYNANATTVRDTPSADYEGNPGIGFHTLNWIERSPSGTPTVYGFVSDYINSGIIGSIQG